MNAYPLNDTPGEARAASQGVPLRGTSVLLTFAARDGFAWEKSSRCTLQTLGASRLNETTVCQGQGRPRGTRCDQEHVALTLFAVTTFARSP